MMPCPYCIHGKTMVIDSSWDDRHQTIRRRRRCLPCGYRWSTLEIDQDQVEYLEKTCSSKVDKHHFPAAPERGQPKEEGPS